MPPLFEALAEIRGGCSAGVVAADALSTLSPDEVLAALVEVQSLVAQIGALNAVLLAKVDLAMLPTVERGHSSTGAAVAVHGGTNPRVTRADQRRGLWLLGFPVIAGAFASGSISQAHVEAFKGVENPRTTTALVEAQEYLVEAAVRCRWDEFQRVLGYWAHGADPDGEEPNDQIVKRSLDYSTNSDGSVTGRFRLDPLAGHAFTTAMDRLVQRLWRHDQETGSTRTVTQRGADAFMILVQNGAANPDANLPGALIHIVMSQTVAEHLLAMVPRTEGPQPQPDQPNRPADEVPLDPDDIDGRCEFINGIPLHPHFAAAAMATARFRRLIFSTDGEILEHGRKTRVFPAPTKQALLVKARGRCRHPGCDAPLTWLEADHLIAWNRNGPTNTTNGQILCSRHNKLKNDNPPDGVDLGPDG
ncbi:MAG: DUF222 domain-containing protein [Actinomycetia bacterium]|nr:DUF222 domain-containing protein [Actinomycetes bacterium]